MKNKPTVAMAVYSMCTRNYTSIYYLYTRTAYLILIIEYVLDKIVRQNIRRFL